MASAKYEPEFSEISEENLGMEPKELCITEPLEMVEVKMESATHFDEFEKTAIEAVSKEIFENERPKKGCLEELTLISNSSTGDITQHIGVEVAADSSIYGEVSQFNTDEFLTNGHWMELKEGCNDGKRFDCEYCNYRSNKKDHFDRHLRTHTGEKHFKCDLCSYRCSQKVHLVMHKRTHTGEKPFNCNFCDFKSSRKSTVVIHIRTHTGEKPFQCPHCQYKSAVNHHLKSHIKKNHR